MPPKKTTDGNSSRRTSRKTQPATMPDAAGMGVAPSAAAEPTRGGTIEAGGADRSRSVTERKPPAASHTTADSAPQKSPVTMSSMISDDDIRQRAYELYEQRGHQGGSPEDDWYQAEQELRSRKGSKSA